MASRRAPRRQAPEPARLQIEYVTASTLRPDDKNPRRMGDEERARLRTLLKVHGVVDPIIARREDRLVIGGHQRLAVLLERGDPEVPVIFLDGLSDAQAHSLNVALNNPRAQGAWDSDKLVALLTEIAESEAPTSGTGFTDEEIADLLDGLIDDATSGEGPGTVEARCVVTCRSSGEAQQLAERLRREGFACEVAS